MQNSFSQIIIESPQLNYPGDPTGSVVLNVLNSYKTVY